MQCGQEAEAEAGVVITAHIQELARDHIQVLAREASAGNWLFICLNPGVKALPWVSLCPGVEPHLIVLCSQGRVQGTQLCVWLSHLVFRE